MVRKRTESERLLTDENGRLVVYVDNGQLNVVLGSNHFVIDSGQVTIANSVLSVAMQKGTSVYTNVTIGNGSTAALAANPARKRAIFYNAGTNVIFLKSGAAANLTSIPLLPAVGIPFIDDFSTDAWFGITALGGGDLRVIEVA